MVDWLMAQERSRSCATLGSGAEAERWSGAVDVPGMGSPGSGKSWGRQAVSIIAKEHVAPK